MSFPSKYLDANSGCPMGPRKLSALKFRVRERRCWRLWDCTAVLALTRSPSEEVDDADRSPSDRQLTTKVHVTTKSKEMGRGVRGPNDGRSPTIAFTKSTEELAIRNVSYNRSDALTAFLLRNGVCPRFRKAIVGATPPSFSAHVRLGERGAPVPFPSTRLRGGPRNPFTQIPWPNPAWHATRCT